MSRPIKFRAWDIPSKTFIYDVTDLRKARHYEQGLTQFTGLHDKNGEEIYEGDIVRNFGHQYTWLRSHRGVLCLHTRKSSILASGGVPAWR